MTDNPPKDAPPPDESQAKLKEFMFGVLDEWADKRKEADKPAPKRTESPESWFGSLFGGGSSGSAT